MKERVANLVGPIVERMWVSAAASVQRSYEEKHALGQTDNLRPSYAKTNEHPKRYKH